MNRSGLALILSLLMFHTSAQAGIFSFCNDLFVSKINSPEKFVEAFALHGGSGAELGSLINRTSDRLILDENLAREISQLGLLKDLGIKLKASSQPLKHSLEEAIENQLLLRIKVARTPEEFLNLVNTLKHYQHSSVFYSEAFRASPFLKRRLLNIPTLQQFYNGNLTAAQITDAIKSNTVRALEETTDLAKLEGLVRLVKRTEIDRLLDPTYLEQSPLVKCGFINPRHLELSPEEEVHELIYLELQAYSQKARSFAQFLDLAEVVRTSEYSWQEVEALLSPMTKLGPEYTNFPELLKSLKSVFTDHDLITNEQVGRRLSATLKLLYADIDHAETATILRELNHGLGFSAAISFLSQKAPQWRQPLLISLESSPFAKKFGITKEAIEATAASLQSRRAHKLQDAAEEIFSRKPEIGNFNRLMTMDNYTNSVPVVSFKDQCSLGACWVHSPIHKIEIELSNKLGRPIELSVDYLYFHYLKAEYKRVLRLPEPSYKLVSEGGFSAMAPELIRKYGALPKKMIPEGKFSAEAIEGWDLQMFNQENIYDLKRDMTNLFAVSNMDKDYVSEAARKELIPFWERSIDKIMDRYYSSPNGKLFRFNGEEHTPRSFARKYLAETTNSSYVHVQLPRPNSGYSTISHFIAGDVERIGMENWNLSTINDTIKRSVDAGKPVQASFYWPKKQGYKDIAWVDENTGRIWARGGIDTGGTFYDDLKRELNGGHAVLIVGYETDAQGKIICYEILNSWGRKSGDEGIYHMDDDFFKVFLRFMDVDQSTGLGYSPLQKSIYVAN